MAMLRWVEAIRTNGYRCTGCGLNLTNEVGMATKKVHILQGHAYCLNCGKMVALVISDSGEGDDHV